MLTSTTAPGKVFGSRTELADHYKSDWHKYNLKRREAGLPVLLEADFRARLEAAQALRTQQEQRTTGRAHLKNNDKNNKKKNKDNNKDQRGTTSGNGVVHVSLQAPGFERLKQQIQIQSDELAETNLNEEQKEPVGTNDSQDDLGVEEVNDIVIEPRQCLFDPHMSANVVDNLERMNRKYGFFVPDKEYLVDLEGLIGYCHEKVKLGHMCLYCHKVFTTWQGCQKHMISKRHTKLRYEPGIDLEDFQDFYDFAEANEDFLNGPKPGLPERTGSGKSEGGYEMVSEQEIETADGNEDGEDGWEDVSDDDMVEEDIEDEDDNDEEDLYDGYEEAVAKMGFDVTPLGELVFPDGRVVGHRTLTRYYKQRLNRRTPSTAVLAAQTAARERLVRGRVLTLPSSSSATSHNNFGMPQQQEESGVLALRQAGIAPEMATGRAGKGILVPTRSGGAVSSFSQLSVYRYRAALRKQRRDDAKGKRITERSFQNINKMDKKANRLMNGVSVAHAAR